MIPIGSEKEVFTALNHLATTWSVVRRDNRLLFTLETKRLKSLRNLVSKLTRYGQVERIDTITTPDYVSYDTVEVVGEVDHLFDALQQLSGPKDYLIHIQL